MSESDKNFPKYLPSKYFSRCHSEVLFEKKKNNHILKQRVVRTLLVDLTRLRRSGEIDAAAAWNGEGRKAASVDVGRRTGGGQRQRRAAFLPSPFHAAAASISPLRRSRVKSSRGGRARARAGPSCSTPLPSP